MTMLIKYYHDFPKSLVGYSQKTEAKTDQTKEKRIAKMLNRLVKKQKHYGN